MFKYKYARPIMHIAVQMLIECFVSVYDTKKNVFYVLKTRLFLQIQPIFFFA